MIGALYKPVPDLLRLDPRLRQTPNSPENLAYDEAMNVAISSCRAWTNSIFSLEGFSTPKTPLDFMKARNDEVADSLCHGILSVWRPPRRVIWSFTDACPSSARHCLI